jgi:hypothetical protein
MDRMKSIPCMERGVITLHVESKMKKIVNKSGFIRAVDYVNEYFFSNPYRITPIVDRWFNQLAIIELDNGKMVPLSGDKAKEFIDITVDDVLVSKEDIQLIAKFQPKNQSERAQERQKLIEQISQLNSKNESTEILEETLRQFDADQSKAQELFNQVVAKGKSLINVVQLEQQYNAKIKNIVYRPNHGLTHSVRAACSVPQLIAYQHQFHSKNKSKLQERELEKLQLMMLFSVVGRQDETGFNDTGPNASNNGNEIYQGFRATSAREYLKYCQIHAKHLYPEPNSLENIYRDAIVVELMGYSTIDDAVRRQKDKPEVFIDYVVEQEKRKKHSINRDEAISLIDKGSYSLHKLFSDPKIANALLDVMNDAHGLDLSRCYPLYPNKQSGPKYINNFNYFLRQSQFLDFSDTTGPDIDKLTSFFQLLRWNFDALELTGQQSTFGLISVKEFSNQKEMMRKEIVLIAENFSDPKNKAELLAKAYAAHNADDSTSYFSGSSYLIDNDSFLKEYRNYLIIRYIGDTLTNEKPLTINARMFHFNRAKKTDSSQIDHHASAAYLVNTMQKISALDGVESKIDLPLISAVQYDKNNPDIVHLTFDDMAQAHAFQALYQERFTDSVPEIIQSSSGELTIHAYKVNYKQLVKDQLLEFKLVTLPPKIEREDQLVNDQGEIAALTLIKQNHAIVRLMSTSDLNEAGHPDYDYFFNALNDPIHNRYSPPLIERDSWKVDRTNYQDPRDGTYYSRQLVLPIEAKYQEPVTEPKSFNETVKDEWTITEERGGAKNTIFTKKMAFSLLPSNGKIKAFNGYLTKMNNYFPIGVLSDVRQMDLKSNRYIWKQNMRSSTKFWIRNSQDYDKKMTAELNENNYKIILNRNNWVLINRKKLDYLNNVYVPSLKARHQKISDTLSNPFYRPTDDFLDQCSSLIEDERTHYKNFLVHFKVSSNTETDDILKLFDKMNTQLKNERTRTGDKYSVSLAELIKEQEKTDDVNIQNEVLASSTKTAVQALYASKDVLFDRLNLALHAMRIKKEFAYDVPLLILSEGAAPYYYTEEKIKEDLLTTYNHLLNNTFPYDRMQFPQYELNKNGGVLFDSGKKVMKMNENHEVIYLEKNVDFQKSVLLDLFKISIPELKNLDELSTQTNPSSIKNVVSDITSHMDLIGSLAREERLMKRIFANTDDKERDAFFLRTISLGHSKLTEIILARDDFNITPSLVDKMTKLSKQHKIPDISHQLKNNCNDLLIQIKSNGWGDNDIETSTFCNDMRNQIEDKNLINNEREIDKLLRLKAELIEVSEAVSSEEMKDVKNQINRLKLKKNHFFGSYRIQEKIDAITQAACKVPLLKRNHIFSATTDPECNKVRNALAAHRYSMNKISSDDPLDPKNAAASFKNINKKFTGPK